MPAARFARDAAIFAACYVALDWVSYIDPLGPFYITPWNPQPALALAWMLLGGLQHLPVVLVTVCAADILVRHAPGGVFISVFSSLVLAGGYGWIAWILRSLLLSDRGLRSLRQLTLFVGTVVGGTAVVGTAFVGLLRGAGLLGSTSLPDAWVRFWVGDAVGILVTMPLLLAVAHAERRAAFARLVRRPETLVQGLVLAVTLWLVFWGLGGDPGYHFYALFMPLIWIAVRGGMVAAIGAIAIVQLGVVAGVHSHAAPFPVLEIQALMAALTLTGLYLGMMVDERARAEESLRQTLRLAAAGDMAGAIAHELNQPLTALANYGQSALMVLGNREYAAAALSEIIHKMLQESQRAAEVVRRLRDFFRAGTTRLQTLQAEELLATVRRLGRQIIGSRPITLEAEAEPGTPALYVDGLQIELVIRNLIANAVEAMEKEAPGEKHIRVRVRRAGESELAVDFLDSGPGLDDDMLERVFEPFVSGKSSGMGLGLAISRAIAEAHGGVLEARAAKHGEFHLVLPCLQSI